MTVHRGWPRRTVIAVPLAACFPGARRALARETGQGSAADGQVTIYSTLPATIWPVLSEAIAARHPGVALQPVRVESIAGIFARYLSETATGRPTADLLIASAVDDWTRLAAANRLLAFEPGNAAGLPRWTRFADRYTMSIEPQAFICRADAHLPTGLFDLARMAAADRAGFAGRIAGYDPFVSPFAYSILQALAKRQGERFWDALAVLAPLMRLETAAPAMIGRIVAGEYRLGLYLPETFVPACNSTLAVVRPVDGLPVFSRTMAIPREAAHAGPAKLVVDYLLSEAGQALLAAHGIMAYRPGVAHATGLETFESLAAPGGPPIVPVVEDMAIMRSRPAFDARLRKLFPRTD